MRTILAGLCGSLALAGCAHGGAEAPADKLTPAQLQADFDALYAGLQRAHYDLYANTPRAEYERLFREMRESLDHPMSAAEARPVFHRLTAAAHTAHANIGWGTEAYGAYREAGGRAFPLGVRIDDGRVFVRENLSAEPRVAVGDEIVALNGQAMRELRALLARNVAADTPHFIDTLLGPQLPGLLWLEFGPLERFDVTLRKANGETFEASLAARTRTEMQAAAASAPATLSLDYTERVARMEPGGVAYLRPGIFLNMPRADAEYNAGEADFFNQTAFNSFIDQAFADFIAADAQALLIDLRDNPGGANGFSDYMISWFADEPFRFTSDFRIRVSPEATASNAARLAGDANDSISQALARAYEGERDGNVVQFPIPIVAPREGARFSGRVFALVNRNTFSNSVSVAAILQDYGFGRVLGEPTADLATTYGAMEHFSLPNTGFSVGFPKAHILRPNGDARVAGVTPDTPIATPLVEAADDPVLQQALSIAAAP